MEGSFLGSYAITSMKFFSNFHHPLRKRCPNKTITLGELAVDMLLLPLRLQ
jgi:hypothetical protein